MKKSRVKKPYTIVFAAPGSERKKPAMKKPAMKKPAVTSINIKRVREGHVQAESDINPLLRRFNRNWYKLNMDVKKWFRAQKKIDPRDPEALVKQLYATADQMMNFANDLEEILESSDR